MIDRLMVLKHYLHYKYFRTFRSRRDLERWQKKKISAHLKYVSAHSPLYRGMSRLEEYPVIHKAYMMEHFDRLNTAGILRKDAEALAVKAERDRNFSPKLQSPSILKTRSNPKRLRSSLDLKTQPNQMSSQNSQDL